MSRKWQAELLEEANRIKEMPSMRFVKEYKSEHEDVEYVHEIILREKARRVRQ